MYTEELPPRIGLQRAFGFMPQERDETSTLSKVRKKPGVLVLAIFLSGGGARRVVVIASRPAFTDDANNSSSCSSKESGRSRIFDLSVSASRSADGPHGGSDGRHMPACRKGAGQHFFLKLAAARGALLGRRNQLILASVP